MNIWFTIDDEYLIDFTTFPTLTLGFIGSRIKSIKYSWINDCNRNHNNGLIEANNRYSTEGGYCKVTKYIAYDAASNQ